MKSKEELKKLKELTNFKLGDSVVYFPKLNHVKGWNDFVPFERYVITGISCTLNNVIIDKVYLNFNEDSQVGYLWSEFVQRIKDTKLARKIHKDKIIKIEKGWIYL